MITSDHPYIFRRPSCLRDATRGLRDTGVDMILKITRGEAMISLKSIKYDDVRRDSMINFMLTWHKLSFLIGHFEV
jgi:hypothetical protein